jgi:hypothetical protein
MKTFDDIEIHRPALARSYLHNLEAQPGRPLALFAPRRVGKTFFLEEDLRPAAKARDYVVVYADVWLHKASPLRAINHALEEALDDVRVPPSTLGRVARTDVKKLGLLGASIELGNEPRRRELPIEPELRLDALIARLVAESGRRLLLMLDEFQALGEVADGGAIIATLRSVLQARSDTVCAVFTGSSQEALAAMMVSAGSPMYQFTQLVTFPTLGDDYLEQLGAQFARVHPGKTLELSALREAFEFIGFKPALMKDLVKLLSADGLTDVKRGLSALALDEKQVAGWRALVAGLEPFDRAVLYQLALGRPPLGRETIAALAELNLVSNPTIGKVRNALEGMRRQGLLVKPQGAYRIADTLFAQYVAALDMRRALL